MTDEVTPEPPQEDPAQLVATETEQANPNLFAGKHTPAGLEKAAVELRQKLGLPNFPDGKTLVGDTGIFPHHYALETEYKAYETMLGKLSGVKKPPESLDVTPAQDRDGLAIDNQIKVNPDAGIEEVLQMAGLANKEQELATQFMENGKLTEDQYAAFAKTGRGRKEVDSFLEGRVAVAQQHKHVMQSAIDNAMNLVGGETQLNSLLEFGKTLPANKINDINQRLKDPGKVDSAVRELRDIHRDAIGAGRAQPLVGDGMAPTAQSSTISTQKDLIETTARAMAGDPASQKRLADLPISEMTKLTL